MTLVYDVGRTNLRAAAYAPATGALGAVRRGATPGALDAVVPAMAALGLAALDGMAPSRVAIAFPGPVGAALRAAFGAHAARTWPGARVWIMNDVVAAGYALVRRGQADFAVTSVGSNVGQKIFLGGRPVLGPHGRGGEIGHLVVDDRPDAPTCDCGARGHLSALASGRGTLALALRRAEADPDGYRRSGLARDCPVPAALDNLGLLRAFRADDPWAVACVREAARPLAGTLAALHLALGLERFALVGGFASAAGPGYGRILAQEARARSWAAGGDWSGMIAVHAAREEVFLAGCGHAVGRAAGRDSALVRLA